MIQPKLWTKDFLRITGINFFLIVAFYFLAVVSSPFAMDVFHSSPSTAGLASSIFFIGAIVSRVFSGRWVEIIGRRNMLYAGLVLFTLINLFYFAIDSVTPLLVLRAFHGAAFGIASTAIMTIATNIIPQERRGEGVGYFALSITLAAAVGPSLAIFLIQYVNYTIIFAVAAIISALAVVNMLFISVPEISLTRQQISEMKSFKLSSFIEPKALPISLTIMIIYFSYSGVMTFLAAFARETNLVHAAAFFFVIYSAAIVVSRPFTGRWLDLKGDNLTMYPAVLIFAMGMILLSQVEQGFSLLLAGAMIGLGLGTIQSSGMAIAIKQTSPHRMGLANSTYFISMDLGVGIGPYVLGLFVPFIGYRGVFAGAAIVGFACIILYYLLHGKKAVQPARSFSP